MIASPPSTNTCPFSVARGSNCRHPQRRQPSETLAETGLKKLPGNISCEVLECGICLTGGGICITGMDSLIAASTSFEVRVAPDPIHSVINGAIQTLQYWKGKENWGENIAWPSIPS